MAANALALSDDTRRSYAERGCDLIAEGVTLVRAAQIIGIPPKTLHNCMRATRESEAMYARARELRAEVMADELLSIVDNATNENWQVARLQADKRQWLMSKFMPRVYGERVDHNVSGTANIVHEIKLTSGLRSTALPPEREIQALPAAEADVLDSE